MSEYLRRYRHLIGFRTQKLEQPAELQELQSLFTMPIPPSVLAFLVDLADCVLYYRYDAITKTGKPKTYSHLLITNIGPALTEQIYQPTTTIGYVRSYRQRQLPDYALPIALQFGKSSLIYVDIRPESGHRVMVSKSEWTWTIVAPTFENFVNSLHLDLRPLLSIFRIGGTDHIQESMRTWFEAVLGPNWLDQLQSQLQKRN